MDVDLDGHLDVERITPQKWGRGTKTRTHRIGVGHRYIKTTIDLLDVDLDGHLDVERITSQKWGRGTKTWTYRIGVGHRYI